MSVAIGIGQGFQPVSGFNYGAKKYSRLRKAYMFTFIMAETLILIGLSIVLINSDGLIEIFRKDPEVVEIGTRALRLQMITLTFVPITVVTEMLFQTTGNKLRASILSALRSGIFFIPTLLILANIRGLKGIQEAQPVAYILTFIPALVMAIIFFIRLPKLDGDIDEL
jgi:Na+-driven multidrug efflux pump